MICKSQHINFCRNCPKFNLRSVVVFQGQPRPLSLQNLLLIKWLQCISILTFWHLLIWHFSTCIWHAGILAFDIGHYGTFAFWHFSILGYGILHFGIFVIWHFGISAFQYFSISAFQNFSISAFQHLSILVFQHFSIFSILAFQHSTMLRIAQKCSAMLINSQGKL